MENEKVKAIALKCFAANRELKEVSVVSDGNAFSNKARAAQHAREIGGEYATVTRAEAEAIEEPKAPEAPKAPAAPDSKKEAEEAAAKEAAEAAAKEAAEKEAKEAAEAAKEAARVAAETELLERNVEEMKYPELASLVAHLGIECEDKKMATLVAALEAKKEELTKPE